MTDILLGNLMLAIQARTFQTYFYLGASNTIHPSRFRHKVTGILFENKVDYTSTVSPRFLPLSLLKT
jgi:endoglucanase Acf2